MDLSFLSEILTTLFQVAMLLFVFIASTRLTDGEKKLLAVFFAFAFLSWLLSDLYWLVYDLLRPGTRMPFAANEIGECALSLLLGAGLLSIKEEKGAPAVGEIIVAIIYMVCNVSLWIAWSGEWMQDILCGLSIGTLLTILVREIKRTNAITKQERIIILIAGFCNIIMQASMFYVNKKAVRFIDLSCYIIMLAGVAYFWIRSLLGLIKGNSTKNTLLVTVAAFVWTILSMYMSTGVFYTVMLLSLTLILPLIYVALKREVKA
ncbi:MAG: hypothetical protein K5669_02000 [Lachnospiraceae bacterium]|nr:hypothetical protein [Lachnospiraceae bacterium]